MPWCGHVLRKHDDDFVKNVLMRRFRKPDKNREVCPWKHGKKLWSCGWEWFELEIE